jgi:integrase
VFPSKRRSDTPVSRHTFGWWLRIAEKRAQLPKLEGGLWHPYRRKWATERKDHPIVDVMAAGGWSDMKTVLDCYQHADQATLSRVMNEPRKLLDAAV